jgi:hypothetical protein
VVYWLRDRYGVLLLLSLFLHSPNNESRSLNWNLLADFWVKDFSLLIFLRDTHSLGLKNRLNSRNNHLGHFVEPVLDEVLAKR